MSIEQQNRYQTIGSGKDLVLVHGWGVNSAVWAPVVDELANHYCVHLVNLPGFAGESELETYSLEAIANLLLSKLPASAVWCGWSLGGLIATYIAAKFPKRVEKLIQVCTSMKFVQQDRWLGVEKNVFDNFKKGLQKQPDKTLSRFLMLQAMGSPSAKGDVAKLKKLLSEQTTSAIPALLAGLDLLNDVDLREQFTQLTMPCLSIFGEHDTLVPIANTEALLTLNGNAKQLVFNASSHAPFISETALFNKQVRSFIS